MEKGDLAEGILQLLQQDVSLEELDPATINPQAAPLLARLREVERQNAELRRSLDQKTALLGAIFEQGAPFGSSPFPDQTILFDHFPFPVWHSGTDTAWDYVNPSWLRLTGRPFADEVGDGWVAGVHPADREELLRVYREAFAGKHPFKYEFRLRQHDRSYRWMACFGMPYFLPDGTFGGLVGSCLDISEQHLDRFEKKLIRNECEQLSEKLTFLLEWMPVGCLLLSERFLVGFWNEAAERIFGFSKSEMIGRSPVGILVPQEDHGKTEQTVEALRHCRKDLVVTCRNHTKAGRIIICEWHCAPLRDCDGRISGFICTAVDVTERIEVQEALKVSEETQYELNRDLTRTLMVVEEALSARIKSEAALLSSERELKKLNSQLRGILDAVDESIILYSRTMEVVWSNRASAPSRRAPAPAYIDTCFHSRAPFNDQLSGENGLILDVTAYPIVDDRGEVESVLEVRRDVTRIINQQAREVRTAHLVSLGELAAGVAHEINNPTHGIINYAEHLARKCPGEATVQEVSSRIVREAERIAHIVRALLDFSRKRDGEKVRVRLDEVLSETLTLCKSQLRKDNIRLFLDQEEKLNPEILADPQQITQVLLNLISNARYSLNLKYPNMDPNKCITISVTRCPPQGEVAVRIAVRDEGMGIPKELLSKVLNPFFTTKPSGVGTGLGLSVSNSIIADHGGTVEVASEPGSFATVSFQLPVWRKDAT